MKKMLFVVIGILLVIFILGAFKDVIIKISAEKGVEVVTGLKLRIGSFKVGILNSLVGIKNLTLFNPKGFKDKVMLDMPEIYVNYDLPDVMKGKIHLEEMRIDMKEFVVVKNEKGVLNLDSLKVVQSQKEGKKPAEKGNKEGKAPDIRIDVLVLKIGKVIYKDYSKGGAPSIKEFDIALSEKYTNIKDPYSLVSLIVVRAMMNTSIANLTNFDLRGLQGTVSETLMTAQKVAAEAVNQAGQTVQKTAEVVSQTTKQTQEVVKETADAVSKTTEELQKAITLPFDSKE